MVNLSVMILQLDIRCLTGPVFQKMLFPYLPPFFEYVGFDLRNLTIPWLFN